MYKKIILIIVSLMLLMFGCSNSKDNNIENENINKIVIYYYSDIERKLGNRVELDLRYEGACVKYSNYYDEIESQFKISNIDKITDFVMKNILVNKKKDNSVKYGSDEQLSLWDITVLTENNIYSYCDLDKYPDYWDELWELIVNASDAEDISEFRLEE